MTASFDNTVGVLVRAFLDGTLLKGNCYACAVGNLCAAATGDKVIGVVRDALALGFHKAKWLHASPAWDNVFMTSNYGEEDKPRYAQARNREAFEGKAREQIEATGYTWKQLAEVEHAFETAKPGNTEEAEFAGLMAVVDVLADIHQVDLTTAEAAKALFVKV